MQCLVYLNESVGSVSSIYWRITRRFFSCAMATRCDCFSLGHSAQGVTVIQEEIRRHGNGHQAHLSAFIYARLSPCPFLSIVSVSVTPPPSQSISLCLIGPRYVCLIVPLFYPFLFLIFFSLCVRLSLSPSHCPSLSPSFHLTISVCLTLSVHLTLHPCPSLIFTLFVSLILSSFHFLSLSFSLSLSLSLSLLLSLSRSLSLSLSLSFFAVLNGCRSFSVVLPLSLCPLSIALSVFV